MKKINETKLALVLAFIALIFGLLAFIRTIDIGLDLNKLQNYVGEQLKLVEVSTGHLDDGLINLSKNYNELRDFVVKK